MKFILHLICVLYPIVLLIYYIMLFVEWFIVRKRIWEPGRKRIYFIIFIQTCLPFLFALLYRILPGSIECYPATSVNDRHVNTVGLLLLLVMSGIFTFIYVFRRETKKAGINVAISKKAKRQDAKNRKQK